MWSIVTPPRKQFLRNRFEKGNMRDIFNYSLEISSDF